MATVRHFALNLVRTASDKRSIKSRRKIAGWDPDYLHPLLTARLTWIRSPVASWRSERRSTEIPRLLLPSEGGLPQPRADCRRAPRGRPPHAGERRGLSKTPASIRMRPPTIGEHTTEVLRELGYSLAEIDDLRQRKLV